MSRVAVLALLAGAIVLAPAASGSSERSVPIRLGVGIGPVNLGMTEAQVRRSLGRPGAVLERRRVRGQAYIELQWRQGDWNVGFVGRKGSRRVVLVGTGLRRHRTPQGVGVGTTEARIARQLRGLRERYCANPHGLHRRQLVLRGDREETVFLLIGRYLPSGEPHSEVGSVEIRGGPTVACGVP
jgi:hypothetical protein